MRLSSLANMFLQGRFDTYPKRRGLARIPELLAAGCVVAMGHDSVLDPWYPLGRADMLDVAFMAVHAAHMSSRTEIPQTFACVSSAPARIMGLEGYGIEKGAFADLVVHDAMDTIDAVRLRMPRKVVVRRGKVVARTSVETTVSVLG